MLFPVPSNNAKDTSVSEVAISSRSDVPTPSNNSQDQISCNIEVLITPEEASNTCSNNLGEKGSPVVAFIDSLFLKTKLYSNFLLYFLGLNVRKKLILVPSNSAEDTSVSKEASPQDAQSRFSNNSGKKSKVRSVQTLLIIL